MHLRIEKLLNQTNNLSVQYIFSSFYESLDTSNKFLMDVYLNNGIERTREIYSDWFEKGKFEKNEFFQKFNFGIEKEEVEIEFQRHNLWREKTKIIATPTILVNGYKLPENYMIEDLRYFKDLDVNFK